MNQIYKLCEMKVRILHDPHNEIDEFLVPPLLFDLLESQNEIFLDKKSQKRLFIANTSIDEVKETIPSDIHFSFRTCKIQEKCQYDTCNAQTSRQHYFERKKETKHTQNNENRNLNEPDIEILFDSEEDFQRYLKLNCPTNFYFDKYFVQKSSLPQKLLEKENDLYIFGPVQVSESDLSKAIHQIDSSIKIKRMFCPFQKIFTPYFIIDFCFSDKKIPFMTSLQHIEVNNLPIKFHPMSNYNEFLHLNQMFPTRFRICDPVRFTKMETKIVQLINLFLPYEPYEAEIDTILEFIHSFKFENVQPFVIYQNLEDCNQIENNHSFNRTTGTIFIQCDSISSAKSVFAKLGGLFFRERPIVATFFPEILFQARIFSLQCETV